jgi:hypothetical protein
MTEHAQSAEVDLGSMSLIAQPAWRFYPLQDRVIGRHECGVGIIQFQRLPLSAVPWPASHEMCMAAAGRVCGYELEPPGVDRAKEHEENCTAGGESFRSGNDYVRVWYRHCPDGMVAAWFAFPVQRSLERGVRELIGQCDRMIASVRVAPPVA